MDGLEKQRVAVSEFEQRKSVGEQFVIPVTALIELGNQICQHPSDRRRYATALVNMIDASIKGEAPWIIRSVTWDEELLRSLVAGDSTGSDLVTLLGDARMGTGDVAVLVERDRFRAETAYALTEVWSRDGELSAHGAPD